MGSTINIKQAAEILGISDKTLRRWLQSGKPEVLVPHWRSGPRGPYKFDRDDVLNWKESRKVSVETQHKDREKQD